jgi:hypothetical protein
MGKKKPKHRDAMMERMYAVAVRDGDDLFLWMRIRRATQGDIYYMFPTGRTAPEWKKWDPHGSLHRDGNFHHKGYDKKMAAQKIQAPDSSFKGSMNMIARPTASHEPRAFGVVCDLAKFSEVMQVPVGILSSKEYETYVSVDITEANGAPSVNTSDGEILAQHAFNDSLPWILVSVVFKALPKSLGE